MSNFSTLPMRILFSLGLGVFAFKANAGVFDWLPKKLPGFGKRCSAFDGGTEPAVRTSVVTQAMAALGATSKALTLPPLDKPTNLSDPHGNPYRFAQGAERGMMTYREYATPENKDTSQMVLWNSYPMGEHAAESGMLIVKSRVYEALGFQTAQPRVVEMDGKKRVLQKRMDGWRKHNGIKLDSNPSLDRVPPNTAQFRELRFASMLLGDAMLLASHPHRAGDDFFLSRYSKTFGTVSNDGTLQSLLHEVPVTWLPIQHPWRTSIADADIQAFRTKLAGLTDVLLRSIIKSAELGDRKLEDDVFDKITRNRDLLLQFWTVADLPGQSSAELLRVRSELPKELFEYLHGDKDRALNQLRLANVTKLESLLKAYAEGTSTNDSETSNVVRNLNRLADANLHGRNLDLWNQALLRTIEIAQHKTHGDLSGIESLGSILLHSMLSESTGHMPARLQSSLLTAYENHPEGLLAVLEKFFLLPSEESYIRDYALAIHTTFEELKKVGKPQTAEILMMGLLASSIKNAELYDSWLSRGQGFHNAVSVRTVAEYAAQALEAFESFKFRRSEITVTLNLGDLAKVFRGLKYDNLGRRQIGQSITPSEAFNFGGATRADRYNVYELLRAYILKKQLGDLPQALLSLSKKD